MNSMLLDLFLKITKKKMMGYTYPIHEKRRISSPYGWRIHPITGKRQFHNGVDISAPQGTWVYPVKMGTVIKCSFDNLNGHFIRVKHPDGNVSGYAHLFKILPDIYPGLTVSKKVPIGKVGTTGRSTAPHLHVSIFTNMETRETLDPETVCTWWED
jgi:murein DD-endopeptidase MepM/ murein hydrolase activator NlpD